MARRRVCRKYQGRQLYQLSFIMPPGGPLGFLQGEGFSPDSYLTGIAMQQTITGMQDLGV